MVDTLKILMRPEQLGNLDILGELPLILDRPTIHEPLEGTRSISGYLKGMHVSASESGLRLSGSIPKYLWRQNIVTPTRNEIKQALDELGDTLGIDLHQSRVLKLHISGTIKTSYRPGIYFDYLGSAQYYQRGSFLNSLYYENGFRNMNFYDKAKEATAKRGHIPRSYQGCNLFRMECRLERNPAKYFKVKELSAADLWSEKGYQAMVQYWLDSYMKINKVQQLKIDAENIHTPTDYFEYLMLVGLETIGGLEGAFAQIEELRGRRALERPEYYSRAKTSLRKKAQKASGNQPNDLILELDNKVEAFAKQAGEKPYLP